MRLAGVFFLLGVLTIGAQERRAADAVLRAAGMPIELELPASAATFHTIQQVLDSARVLYGIEQAPDARDSQPIDLARQPERTIRLNGLRLGNALDTIVEQDPRYEWTEADGRILVRAAGARGVSALDARVERFAVTRVSFVDALAALVHAIDPARPRPTAGTFGLAFEVANETRSATDPIASKPRLITVTRANATVLEILQAIASAHGQLSWNVQYDDPAAGFENANIAMTGAGTFALASTARATREVARRRDGLLLPLGRSLEMMVSIYTQRVRVQAGLELLDAVSPGMKPIQQWLDLTDLPSNVALSRIVAFDSRYEIEEAGGIFNIRPKPQFASGAALFDERFPSFSVTNATIFDVFDALRVLLRASDAGSGSGAGGVLGLDEREQQRRIAEGRAKRLSLTLGNVTLREILNAICRAHGTLSWSVRPEPGAPGRYKFSFDSFDGWGDSRTLRLP